MKILLTGSTPIQVGSKRTQLRIITAAEGWNNALTDLGHDVDWRSVTPGEDLKAYDRVIAILNKPNSITSAYANGAIWTLVSRPDAIVALDDWQTKELVAGLDTYSKNMERCFRLRGGDLPVRLKHAIFDYMGKLAREPWDHRVIAPVFGNGELGKLDIPAEVIGIDPTNYVHRYEYKAYIKERRWIMATLLDKPIIHTRGWPTDVYGPQDRGAAGIGRKGVNASPRMTEPELADVYARNWGVVSPAHYHAGSGWWRVRYIMASDAGSVLSADIKEVEHLGPAYRFASIPDKVEHLPDVGLRLLAESQRKEFNAIIWPKDRVKETLASLIGEKKMPRFATPTGKAPASPPVNRFVAGKADTTPAKKEKPVIASYIGAAPIPNEKEGSGAYMRRMMVMGINDTDTILAAVHQHFPGSKAGPSDVSYNRNWLKTKEGFDPRSGVPVDPKPSLADLTTTPLRRGPGRPPKYAAERVEAHTPPVARQTEMPFDGGSPTLALRREIERLGEKRKSNAPIAKFTLIALDFIEEAMREMS